MSEPGLMPTANRLLRVVIVDDYPMLRQSLRFALLAAEDLEVVGEAADGEGALQVCRDQHPDVVLLDLHLPGRLSSVEVIRALRRMHPVPQVLVHTADYDMDRISEAVTAGAYGYVLKQGVIEDLFAAIRAAHNHQQAIE